MKSSDLCLLFFIIYDVIITWLFLYIWLKTRAISIEKSKYIDELLFELAKARRK